MKEELIRKTRILDGGTGTMFQARGMKPGEDSTAFALAHPEVVEEVAREYLEAGAEFIYTPTFNLNAEKVAALGETTLSLVKKLAAPALKLREEYAAVGRNIIVAFDVGPQGKMLEPMGDCTFEEAYEFYAEEANAAAAIGADIIAIETMTNLYDVKAAVLAMKENTELPVMVTMSFEENGRTFTGNSIEAMAVTLEGLGVDAIGINCSLGPVQILPLIKELKTYTELPVVAKPNAGLPDPETGGYDITCSQYVEAMKKYVDEGVDFIGGCCGTTPEYIKGMAEYAAVCRSSQEPEASAPKTLKVCSGSRVVAVDHVAVIGERLNPTGKKKLKKALLEEDYDYVIAQAISQAEAGAEILDVNVGVPGIDEAAVMPKLIKKLQAATDLPLQIDSSNPEAIEAALRVYDGKAIVNSVNGDREVLDRVLPVVKKYGAAVIGLTLDSGGIPDTCRKRFEIAERILAAAREYGIPDEDVIIDSLTLTASAQQKEVDETLKTVRRVTEELKLATALGVSNVSFGLPLRSVVNRTFLTMAMENGLTLPIINPNDEDMMASIYAFNVLKNRDEGAAAFIDRYADAEVAKITGRGGVSRKSAEISPVAKAIDDGIESEVAAVVEKLLGEMEPMDIVNGELIPALDRVGKGFEKGEIFLPAMMQSAQAAQAGFDVIKKAMEAGGSPGESKGDVVIATVKGDIHDIGKNIVRVIMENYGFNMIDLGRDVPVQDVVEAVTAGGVKLVGLSALMTTTLPSMAETIKAVKAAAPDCKVMVGGAVLTEDYALEIGADFYCRDAMKSVEAAKKVFG
ncbi:MAG: homocysteine S-methyltransferase family protein [Clostridiales bacterium]|nr:homocysteine S-methyltransferase family protein [Clostridiales bacterium]